MESIVFNPKHNRIHTVLFHTEAKTGQISRIR